MLVTLGKGRGYIERQEIQATGGHLDAIRYQLLNDMNRICVVARCCAGPDGTACIAWTRFATQLKM